MVLVSHSVDIVGIMNVLEDWLHRRLQVSLRNLEPSNSLEMSLTALSAILGILSTIESSPRHRIISETPSNEACARFQAMKLQDTPKETFDGHKWTKYYCDGSKGRKVEYEIIDPEEPEDEILDQQFRKPQDLNWREKKEQQQKQRRETRLQTERMQKKHRIEQDKRDRYQKGQMEAHRRRVQAAQNPEKRNN